MRNPVTPSRAKRAHPIPPSNLSSGTFPAPKGKISRTTKRIKVTRWMRDRWADVLYRRALGPTRPRTDKTPL